MKYEVVLCKLNGQDWRVEASDDESEGECYVTIFTASDAERRAREYCEWMNSKAKQ